MLERHAPYRGPPTAPPGEAVNDNSTDEQDRFEAAVMRELAGELD